MRRNGETLPTTALKKETAELVRGPPSRRIHQGLDNLQPGRSAEVYLHSQGGPVCKLGAHKREPEDARTGPKRDAERAGHFLWQTGFEKQEHEH